MFKAIHDKGSRTFNSALEAVDWQAVHHSFIFILEGVDLSHLDIVQCEHQHLSPSSLTPFKAVDEFIRLKGDYNKRVIEFLESEINEAQKILRETPRNRIIERVSLISRIEENKKSIKDLTTHHEEQK
jgi:hypothetical protein